MAFRIKTRPGDGLTLRRIFETIREISSTVVFNVGAKGISAQTMDDAQVCLLNFFMPSTAFESYSVPEEKVMRMGLDLSRMIRILRFAEVPQDTVTLSYDGSQDYLSVRIDGSSSSEFTSSLIYIETNEMIIPDAIPASMACVSVNSTELAHMCKDLSIFGENMDITLAFAEEVRLTCSVQNEFGKAIVTIPCECTVASEGTKSGTYALRYLNSACKGSSIAPRMKILMDDEAPIQFSFELDCGGFLRFFLAPKIRDDEDI